MTGAAALLGDLLIAWGNVDPLTLLLAGMVLLPVAWALLGRGPGAGTMGGPPSPDRLLRRMVLGAALGESAAYLAAASLLALRSGSAWPLLVPFAVPAPMIFGTCLGAACGAVSARRHWRPEGTIAYLGLGYLAAGFLGYTASLVRAAPNGAASVAALLLLGIELFGFGIVLLYQFYSLEFLAGAPDGPPAAAARPRSPYRPMVVVQVPSFNEPVELVESCLASIRASAYPRARYRVQLLDDSTDPGAAPRLTEICRRLDVEYLHRTVRTGYKAGALNRGLAGLPPDVELLAIVDADYTVDPRFLDRTVGYFEDPAVAWVQTPQSYRNRSESRFTRYYALADAYFYSVIQPVRHRAHSSIFCGTMGVLRRRALEAVGGWDERCLTEDAEVSLRLYAAGWRSVYLPEVLGNGLAPHHFGDLRAQFSRWAFGGLDMLRRDGAALRSPRLTARQRMDFLASGLFWMDGAFLVAMAGAIVALALGPFVGLTGLAPTPELLAVLSVAPALLVLDGLVKTRLALSRTTGATWADALGVMGFWYALKVGNLRASLRGALGRPMSFVRTPKTVGAPVSSAHRIRPALLELLLAAGVASVALTVAWAAPGGSGTATAGKIALVGWLGFYAAAFAAAPLFSLLAGASRARSAPRTE